MFLKFSHITLYVHNLDRAAAWYQEKLGFEASSIIPGRIASLRHRELRVSFDLEQVPEGETLGKFGPVPYLDTPDLDQVIHVLERRGVQCGKPASSKGGPRYSSFRDSEGNLLGLEEAK